MIIKVKTTTETSKEINLPYFTKSHYGTYFGHYTPEKCIMIASDSHSVSILYATNGFDCPEIKQFEFEQKFNDTMSKILTLANNPI